MICLILALFTSNRAFEVKIAKKNEDWSAVRNMATTILFLVPIVLTVGFTRADRSLEPQNDPM